MTLRPRFGTPHGNPLPMRPTYPDILGPLPEATLACWIDLGLSDAEIARYFGLEEGLVATLASSIRHAIATQKPKAEPSLHHRIPSPPGFKLIA